MLCWLYYILHYHSWCFSSKQDGKPGFKLLRTSSLPAGLVFRTSSLPCWFIASYEFFPLLVYCFVRVIFPAGLLLCTSSLPCWFIASHEFSPLPGKARILQIRTGHFALISCWDRQNDTEHLKISYSRRMNQIIILQGS